MQTDDAAQQAQQAQQAIEAGVGHATPPPSQQQQQQPIGASESAAGTSAAAGASAGGEAGVVGDAPGGSSSGGGREAVEQEKEREGEEGYRRQKAVFAALPHPLLRSLPQLLADEGLSDKASTLLKMVIQGLNLVTPPQLPISLGELRSVLSVLSHRAGKGLEALAGADVAGGNALLASDVARVGRLMLRCVTCLWENAGQMVREAPKREAPQQEVDACRHVVLGTLGELQHALGPLWRHLSMVAGQVEGVLRASKGNEANKVLPPGAAQLQPLVECLFILGDVRNQLEPKQQDAAPGAVPALEASPSLPTPSSPRLGGGGGGPGGPLSEGPSSSQGGATEDGQAAALSFAEHHRRLVNALVHAHPGLLTTSMQLLMKMPRLLDFDNKRAFFRTKVKELGGSLHYGTVRISVRRDHVFEDSFYQLRMRTSGEMKGKLNVTFQGEEGVDAGGVTREWFQVMSREMFNPQFSLFQAVPEGGTTFQPNPNSIIQNDEVRGTNHLDFFKFVGRVVGKALHDGHYIDAHFTRSFYKHLLGQPLTYGDIEAVDPDFYKNLAWMLENDITDVLDLTFSEEEDFFGRKQNVELKPGGAHIKVTNENKREYVDLVARHRMTTAIRDQIESFQKGFWDLVPKELITMFTDHELELLISGLPEIDVDDLRANTDYAGYSSTSPVVRWFWELVREMDKQDLALLVQFVTGTSKVPLDGFKALQGVHGPQRFSIHKAFGDKVRLPSAHTCFNQLDLIEYDSKEQLRERLMIAIHEGSTGFGFA